MIIRQILYFGENLNAVCDGKCDKAFGVTHRPSNKLSDKEDDFEFLADDEIGIAPIDPQTYEGGCCKPEYKNERLNKWCVRECEHCLLIKDITDFELKDFSIRRKNLGVKK